MSFHWSQNDKVQFLKQEENGTMMKIAEKVTVTTNSHTACFLAW
jgi:hypothetical protein